MRTINNDIAWSEADVAGPKVEAAPVVQSTSYRNRYTSIWTDERVEQLKQLWADGLAVSQIAAQIGEGVSRNAVIGKIFRLGLSKRAQPRSNVPRAPRRRTATPTLSILPLFDLGPMNNIIPETPINPVSFFDLQPHHCRWPCDGQRLSILFCGNDAMRDRPYCSAHHRRAYVPSRPPQTKEQRAAIERRMAKMRNARAA